MIGEGHDKPGKIDQVYVDRQTGEPTFASVKTGLFGSKSAIVPRSRARRAMGTTSTSPTPKERIDADDAR